MRIAICGSGHVLNKKVAIKASKLGVEIAKKGYTILTGACHGYPNEAAKAAFKNGGEVIGYSPAENKAEHIKKYNFPIKNFTHILYTGAGIPARNLNLIKNADVVILIDGKVGTLNEFTLAFHFKKKMGVLTKTGGISDKIREIAKIIDKDGEKNNIVYDSDCKKLVEKIT